VVDVDRKEEPMKSPRKLALLVASMLALSGAPAAYAQVDYSKNSVSGDYAPAAVSAEPAPAPSTASDSSFEWDDAAIGAGAALAVVLCVTLARIPARRVFG
jgi:hypothetical protein